MKIAMLQDIVRSMVLDGKEVHDYSLSNEQYSIVIQSVTEDSIHYVVYDITYDDDHFEVFNDKLER